MLQMSFHTHLKCKTLCLKNDGQYACHSFVFGLFIRFHWEHTGCCCEQGHHPWSKEARLRQRILPAEVSLSKTPNPWQLRERCSPSDPVFWPPCTLGASSRGCIHLSFFFLMVLITQRRNIMFACRSAPGGQRTGSALEQCLWKMVVVHLFAQGHSIQHKRQNQTCATWKAAFVWRKKGTFLKL